MTKGKQNMGHRILLDKYYIQYKSLLNVRIVAMLHLARGARSAPRCELIVNSLKVCTAEVHNRCT